MSLLANQQIVQKDPPETGHDNAAAQDRPVAAFCHVRRNRSRRRRAKICNGGDEEVTDEKADVERKIVALQKIVPGGDRLAVEELFGETAEYILALECQVNALRFLAAIVQSSEKKKRMLDG